MSRMGCLKLSYRGQGEGVEANASSILWEVYKKGGSEEKKSVEYYRYGFQGEFAEEDSETGWNSFELRMYDPVIARWLTIDPYAEFWSPYVAFGNNPVNYNDPSGGSTGDPPAKVQGIGINDFSIAPQFDFNEVSQSMFLDVLSLPTLVFVGSHMNAWEKFWYDVAHSGGGIEFFNSGLGGQPLYHVRDGVASHGIDDVHENLIVFERLNAFSKFKKGHIPRHKNYASRKKELIEHFKFGVDAVNKSKANKGLETILKPAAKPQMLLMKKDSTIDLHYIKDGKLVVETVYEYDTVYINNEQ